MKKITITQKQIYQKISQTQKYKKYKKHKNTESIGRGLREAEENP